MALQNRYTHLTTPDEVAKFHATFQMFDRDGGGDVDLRELGLMFRQMGESPSEQDMRTLIASVDHDGSGTVDFEEFTLLMLRFRRLEAAPQWLYSRFRPSGGEDPQVDSEV